MTSRIDDTCATMHCAVRSGRRGSAAALRQTDIEVQLRN